MPQSKLTVGNVEISVLHDSEMGLPTSATFPDVPASAWTPYQQQYPEAFIGTDNIRVHFECYLVRSEGRIILVDTGLGTNASNPGTIAAFGGRADGLLIAELRSAGLGVEDVDTVFLTHLHPDHMGWNLSREGSAVRATFPKARYLAHQADWNLYEAPRDEEKAGFSFWESTVGPLKTLGVLDLLSNERSLTSEVTAIPTPGHTPGSMSLTVASAGECALIMGDVFHNPTQVTETDWVVAFDEDPALAIQTRRTMVDRAEQESAPMAICHSNGFGRVVRIKGQRYWQVI